MTRLIHLGAAILIACGVLGRPLPAAAQEGCAPGYWKNHLEDWVGVGPGDDYEAFFGVDASFSLSLFDVVRQGGGGERALGRHAVAALLSAFHPDVAYAFSVADVIAFVQEAYATGDFRGIKNLLETENQRQLPEFCEEIGIG